MQEWVSPNSLAMVCIGAMTELWNDYIFGISWQFLHTIRKYKGNREWRRCEDKNCHKGRRGKILVYGYSYAYTVG